MYCIELRLWLSVSEGGLQIKLPASSSKVLPTKNT